MKKENAFTPDVVVAKKQNKLLSWAREWSPCDLLYVSVVLFVHVLCLFAPLTFTWGRLQLALVRYLTSGLLGITLCYHRELAHASFKLPKTLEYMFAFFGFHALQGDPMFWVSTHRYHHKFTDTNRDPHSPVEGFWFSHVFWIFDQKYRSHKAVNSGDSFRNIDDLMSQRYYRLLQSTRVPQVVLLVVTLYMFGGFPFLVWGIGVPCTWGYHVTFCVNSVCHTWGSQAWNTEDLSRNNWFVALFTFGEGWHNNHHAFEFSARQGLEWWQIDPTWYVIYLLKFVGLATHVNVPSEIQKDKMYLKREMDEGSIN